MSPYRPRFWLIAFTAMALAGGVVAVQGDHIAGVGNMVRVVDGDTLEIAGETVRIENLDAPEMRGACSAETALAARAKARLEQLVRGKVELRRNATRPKDRYGRTLAVVTVDGRDVAGPMITEGLARPWRGKSSDWC